MNRSTNLPARARAVGIALLVAMAATVSPHCATLSAQTVDWDNSAGGLFADGANWLGGLTPGMIASARFALPDTYAVDFAGAGATNVDLLVSGGAVELTSTIGVPTYTLSGTATIGGSLELTSIELAVSGLVIDGGQLTANADSVFTLAPVGPLTLQNAGQLDFAIDLDLVGATVIVDGAGTMLSTTGTDLNLTSGSLLLVSNDAIVSVDRFRGLAAVTEVSSGGHIAANETLLGAGGSASALELLTTTTADLGATDIAVSNVIGTDGTLTISSGATATADSVNIATAGVNGQTGELHVGGSFTQNGAATMTLGADSQLATVARLRIDDGGLVTTGTGALSVYKTGKITNNGGTLSVLGDFLLDGGTYDETDASSALGLAAGATWTIQNGGQASYLPETTLSFAADTALVIDGSDSFVNNVDGVEIGTTAGATARLTLRNDAALSLADLTLSETADGGNARLEILDGAKLTVTENLGIASAGFASAAVVDINGEDSLLDYQGTSTLEVGSAAGGTAELLIRDMGRLDLGSQGLHVAAGGIVRLDNGGLTPGGDILVEGGRIEQTAALLGQLDMPSPGGALRIVAGGSVDLVEDLTVVDAAIQVDAVGSTLHVAGNVSIVADGASGAGLVTANQAQVSVDTLQLGSTLAPEISATARVLSGGALTADTIRVGDPDALGTAASANLEISGGGSRVELTFGGAMTIGANGGTLANQGVVDLADGGVLDASSGTLAIRSSGMLNINGGTLSTAPITTGQGLVQFGTGTIDWRGDFAIATSGLLGTDVTLASDQELIVAGATTIDPAATLTINGGSLETETLADDGDFGFLSGRLRLTAQDLTVDAAGLLGGNLTLGAEKHLAVDQTIAVEATATLELAGGTLGVGSLLNSGHLIYDAGKLDVASSLTNLATGRLFIGGDRTLVVDVAVDNAGRIQLGGGASRLAGSGTLVNTGLITGDGYIDTPLDNAAAGELRATAGSTLAIAGATSANVGLVNLLGGTIEFSQAFVNGGDGRIAGHGTAIFGGGLDNQGRIQISANTLDIYGAVANRSAAQIITSGGGVTTFYDNVVHNGAEIRTSDGSRSVFFGDVSGAGPFTGGGIVEFEGDVNPGNSPAEVVFEGDVSFGAGSTITLEVGGTTPGSEYDTLSVGGTATLDGTLLVDLIDDFTPSVDNVFTLMTFGARVGEFNRVEAVGVLSGYTLETTYTDTSLRLSFAAVDVPGDANGDGLVDGVDYLVWAGNFGETDPPDGLNGASDGDFNDDGVVDGVDYLVWADNFGSGGVARMVPEPASWMLLLIAGIALAVVISGHSQARR